MPASVYKVLSKDKVLGHTEKRAATCTGTLASSTKFCRHKRNQIGGLWKVITATVGVIGEKGRWGT